MNPNTTSTNDTTASPTAQADAPQVTPPAQSQAVEQKASTQTVVKETAPKAAPQPTTDVEKELKALKATISADSLAMIAHIESAANKLGVTTGHSMSTQEINAAQNDIFISAVRLITKASHIEFNAVMYTISELFKRHGQSRIGGLSKERVLMDIGFNPNTNSAQWAYGRSDADLTWFRTFVTVMHMAHERGGSGIKQLNIDVLYSLPAIKAEGATRLKEWLLSCRPL